MDKALERLIVNALKEKREELHKQLIEIVDALEMFEQKKEPLRIRTNSDMTPQQERIIELLTVKWATAEQIGFRTGMRKAAAARTLNNLVETADVGVEKQTINGITMYRRQSTVMRLGAGYGEVL